MRLSAKNLIVPLLPMREEIIYPGSTTPFFVGRKSSMEALDKALSGDRQIIVVAQRVSSVEEPKDEDLYEVGVLGRILQVMRLPNGTVKALFEGQHRAKVLESMLRDKDYSARIEVMDAKVSEKDLEKLTDLSTKARVLAREYFKKKKSKTREEVLKNIEDTEPHSLADRLASMMEIERELKQKLLEEIKPIVRLETLIGIMEEEKKISKLESQLKKQVKEQMSSSQKEDYLEDQLKSIQKELGQMDDPKGEMDELARKVKEAKMPNEVRESAEKEVKKLKMMSPLSAEANVIRNYLEWLVAMPWDVTTEDNFDLKRAQKILDEDHYGLEKVKERIIEYLAVASLKKSLKLP